MRTTTHHPSCPAREHADRLARATQRPRSSGAALTITILERRLADAACLCGPEAAAEDQVILSERTADTMLLDVLAHAAAASSAWLTNAHTRRAPKGLLSCVLLDNELDTDQPMARSWGAK